MSGLPAAERALFHGPPASAIPLLRAAAETAPRARWLLGAALGALGRYGEASGVLTGLREGFPYPSLAASTLASHYRQLGRHADALGWDGRAAELAGDDPEASFDARLGLAADAVGLGDLATARRRLAAAAGCDATHTATRPVASHSTSPPPAPGGWRQAVRCGWVETEIALLAGDPVEAIRPAEAGLAVARTAAAPRHVAKCLLFLGAARHVADAPGSVQALNEALTSARHLGALPLRWVAAALLAESADRRGAPDLGRDHRREAAATLAEIAGGLPQADRSSFLGRADITSIMALSD